jgi:hypothetical protein
LTLQPHNPCDAEIDGLFDPDVDARWRAAGNLVTCGGAILTQIHALVNEADWSVAHIAIWVLGELRDPRSLDLLAEALESPSLHVRLSAARALEKFGSGVLRAKAIDLDATLLHFHN